MAKIMIRQLEERVATSGLFMGETGVQGPFRRKLEPGEIVEVPDDMEMPDGRLLMDALWETGTIDIVPDSVAVTRPLTYKNRREAMLCSPTFKPNGPDEELERDKAIAAVEQRLLDESSDSPPEAESPEDDTPAAPPPKAAKPNAATRRRQRRGAKPQASDHGAQAIT